jgi:transcriptional regulator with PAS, ATPase and Fis domain
MTLTIRALVVVVTAFLVAAAVPTGAVAQSQPPWAEEMRADMNAMVERYNQNASSLDLGIGDALLEDEHVTVRVVDEQGRVAHFNFETNGQKAITGDVEAGKHEQTTLLIKTDRATMNEISTASNPVAALKANVDDNDVTFEGKTPTNWVLATGFSVAKALSDTLSKFL